MKEHHCLLCMGSNTDRFVQLEDARKALIDAFPDIRFGEPMETRAIGNGFHSPFCNQLAEFTTTLKADAVHNFFKELEHRSGRIPGDKARGIVKLDIDLLKFDDEILKPGDMQREYIYKGLKQLQPVLQKMTK